MLWPPTCPPNQSRFSAPYAAGPPASRKTSRGALGFFEQAAQISQVTVWEQAPGSGLGLGLQAHWYTEKACYFKEAGFRTILWVKVLPRLSSFPDMLEEHTAPLPLPPLSLLLRLLSWPPLKLSLPTLPRSLLSPLPLSQILSLSVTVTYLHLNGSPDLSDAKNASASALFAS
jgi:hypothetical protein